MPDFDEAFPPELEAFKTRSVVARVLDALDALVKVSGLIADSTWGLLPQDVRQDLLRQALEGGDGSQAAIDQAMAAKQHQMVH